MGYKVLVDDETGKAYEAFYLNVVGYKEIDHAQRELESLMFYLNVVGYKECAMREKRRRYGFI